MKGGKMLARQITLILANTQEELDYLCQINNNIDVELASGGVPPMQHSFAIPLAEYEYDIA
jgi:hypothetical protein